MSTTANGYRTDVSDPVFRAFLDESSANRGEAQQEYLVCAALIPDFECDDLRDQLGPLLLPGQVKVHWTDESERRRQEIVARIVELGPINVVISHLDARRRKVERYRRKCLERTYHELIDMQVYDLTLECRTDNQDRDDLAHIVALRGQGMDRQLRISHRRGGDEPLLWIADVVLGAVNSAHLGQEQHLEALQSTLMIEERTADSLQPIESEA